LKRAIDLRPDHAIKISIIDIFDRLVSSADGVAPQRPAGSGVAEISAPAAGADVGQRETDSGPDALRAPSAGPPGILRHQYKYLSIIILLKGVFLSADTGGAALPTAEERADP
jgi:hypothetical protein